MRRAITHFLIRNRINIALLLFVLAWCFFSWCVYRFETQSPNSNIRTFTNGLWWGVVTLLTVGYGDYYPVTFWGRMCAVLLMLTGIAAIGIITAKFSSILIEEVIAKGKKNVDPKNLKNHYVICGWKDDMANLLQHILDYNPGVDSSELVLIANVAQNDIDILHAESKLENVKVIIGEYFHENVLRQAAPERARKILLLADRTPSKDGHIPSATEADARTIMAAMTLSAIAGKTLVVAELLDPKLDHYFKLAGVSEVIYSREYSRLLFGNASGGTGISNIIFDLLDPTRSGQIKTLQIPHQFCGKTFGEFRRFYEEEHSGHLVIGVLENTGNMRQMRELALREAQKTSDVSRLLSNLSGVKELRCNHPIFNPPRGYTIKSASAAIVVVGSLSQAKVEPAVPVYLEKNAA